MAVRAPVTWRDAAEHRRLIADAVNLTLDGHTNAVGTVTLTEAAGTTVVNDDRAGVDSVIVFMPLTATAAAEVATGNMYVSSRGKGTFTISHTNGEESTLDFAYLLYGTASQAANS